MFARPTPAFVVLVTMIGAVAANDDPVLCSTVCCKNAWFVSTGWAGSSCWPIATNGACAYHKLCCFDPNNTSCADPSVT